MSMRLPLVLAGGVFAAIFFWPASPPAPVALPVQALPVQAPAVTPRQAAEPLEITLDRKGDGHFYATVDVNGRPIRFLVDTGATAIALTANDARALGFGWTPAELTTVGRGASGEVMGKIVELHHVKLGGKEAWNMRAAIIPEGLPVSLLGQSFLSQIGSVKIANNQMVLR
jgi:aspartyl protease family protein